MSEKTAFQKAKEQAAGANLPAVLPESSDNGSTALTVTPADQEVLAAEREHYAITVKLEEAAVQQFLIHQDLSAMKPAMQVAFLQYEKKRLGVEGHCIELLKNKTTGKVGPYYNDECAVQMKDRRGAKTEYSNYGTVEINGTTLAHVDCTMTKADGRPETRRAYLDVTGIKGQDLGNLLMKLETKAHRRSVLKGFGLTADSPEDGDGTIIKSLEGTQEPERPAIQSVFGQAGSSLIGTVQQPQSASNQPAAAQETQETVETEQAEDAEEIEIESQPSSAAPSGEAPGKSDAAAAPEQTNTTDTAAVSSSSSAQNTEAAPVTTEPGKSESGTKSTKGKKTKSQESPSTTSTSLSASECAASENQTPGTATGQSDKANTSPSPESAPSTSTETNSGASSEGKSNDADSASGQAKENATVKPVADATSAGEEAAAPSEDNDPDFDDLFSEEEEEELDFDPEDAKIASEPQLRELFAIAKACGWSKEDIGTELQRRTKAPKPNDVPKLLTVGEWKQGKEWFSEHSPGDQWFPIGEEPTDLVEGEEVQGE